MRRNGKDLPVIEEGSRPRLLSDPGIQVGKDRTGKSVVQHFDGKNGEQIQKSILAGERIQPLR